MKQYLRPYLFPFILTSSILLGGLVGYLCGERILFLKPVGNIFLNLILTAIVPLVFFSVASAIVRLLQTKQLIRLFSGMLFTFLITGLMAAIFMVVIVKLFPPAADINFQFHIPEKVNEINLLEQIVTMFTVTDFMKLFSHENMLPLLLFSILVGAASATSGNAGKSFATFLQAGNEVFTRIISFIMLLAPIGFFAFFAVLIAELGPQLMTSYFYVTVLYYTAAVVYTAIAFSLYAYLSGDKATVFRFWKHIHLPALTSLATCSSAASIPANMLAAQRMGISPQVYETVIPLGTFLHKQGSILGAIVKIAFLFGVFHLNFSGLSILLMAIFSSLLVGTVMGAIPSGGMLGEMLILSVYGFPPQSLLVIVAISIIIDPLATMINVTGNTVNALLVNKLTFAYKEETVPRQVQTET